MPYLDNLLQILKQGEPVYLQTHNFPDHDAVASAFGLQYLLGKLGIPSFIIYEGTLQRDSLKRLIKETGIPAHPAREMGLKSSDRIIIVDGCKGNKNVTDLVGEEIGIIDHHEVIRPEDVSYADIRPEYGACCTIIYQYFEDYGIEIPRITATALLAGLLVDTSQMTRGVCREDVIAYSGLYPRANITLVNSLLRNNIQQKDLGFYKKAIEKVRLFKNTAFCYFDDGCSQNLLGILGDFFLSLQEVDFVLLCARNADKINFSLRSEKKKWNAAAVVQDVLEGIGFGGGHADMAGGIMNSGGFMEEEIYGRCLNALRLK